MDSDAFSQKEKCSSYIFGYSLSYKLPVKKVKIIFWNSSFLKELDIAYSPCSNNWETYRILEGRKGREENTLFLFMLHPSLPNFSHHRQPSLFAICSLSLPTSPICFCTHASHSVFCYCILAINMTFSLWLNEERGKLEYENFLRMILWDTKYNEAPTKN